MARPVPGVRQDRSDGRTHQRSPRSTANLAEQTAAHAEQTDHPAQRTEAQAQRASTTRSSTEMDPERACFRSCRCPRLFHQSQKPQQRNRSRSKPKTQLPRIPKTQPSQQNRRPRITRPSTEVVETVAAETEEEAAKVVVAEPEREPEAAKEAVAVVAALAALAADTVVVEAVAAVAVVDTVVVAVRVRLPNRQRLRHQLHFQRQRQPSKRSISFTAPHRRRWRTPLRVWERK